MAGGDGKSPNCLARLHHFLRTGQETGCYQPSVHKQILSKDKVPSIEQLLSDDLGRDAVDVIVQFSREQLGTREDTVPFTLALCARSCKLTTKMAAYDAVQEVCRLPRDLFLFVHYSELMSKPTSGWGRAQRTAVSLWYNSKEPKVLAEAVTRYVSRYHWTHRDLFRLAHLKPINNEISVIAKYVIKGLEAVKKELITEDGPSDLHSLIRYLEAVEELKHTKDEQLAARLIESHGLHLEHVPTHFFKSKEVWTSLVPRVSLNQLLQYLPKLSQFGFLRPNSPMMALVVEQLKSEVANPQAKLQPVDVFLALKKYEESGKSPSGRPAKHRPMPVVMDALHNLFIKSFKNIPPTGKRFLIAIDVRNPMVHSKIPGCSHLTPAVAVALLTLGLLHAEAPGQVQVVAFSTRDMFPINLRSDMLLAEVTKCMRETPMGPVNCARPLAWAKNNNKPVDVFVVCTDNQTKPSEIHPMEALRQYRQSMNLPQTKLVVCALASKGFTLASPDDPNMLDIAGFDSYVPKIINHFARTVW